MATSASTFGSLPTRGMARAYVSAVADATRSIGLASPAWGGLRQLLIFPPRVGAGAHVRTGLRECRGEGSERRHSDVFAQEADHPFAIASDPPAWIKEAAVIEYYSPSEKGGATQR